MGDAQDVPAGNALFLVPLCGRTMFHILRMRYLMIRILLADDHPVVLAGVKRHVDDQPDMKVVCESTTGWGAVGQIEQFKPDVAVLDVGMPDLNGILAARRILETSNKTAIVGLSIHTSHQMVHSMLAAGATGYVTKNSPACEVITAIRTVAMGGTYLSDDIAAIAAVTADGRFVASNGEKAACLSSREKEVLQLIAEGKSTKDIARMLHLSPHTINRHRTRIMDKLGLRSIAELTRWAISEGLSPLP